MKNILIAGLLMFSIAGIAQKQVSEKMAVKSQSSLDLDFAFADEIEIITWEKNEVLVEVEVDINNGEDNDLFQLKKRETSTKIYFEMDREAFEDRSKDRKRNCWDMELNFKVYLPKNLRINAETISGNYSLVYYGRPVDIKTISGDIDLTVPQGKGVDFHVKTISGEVYSDLDIEYPDGKDGLRQIVGMNVEGRIDDGGEYLDMETISGDIFLRKG